MADYLGICAVRSGSERQAQRDIERAGFGTRVPCYRTAYGRQDKQQIRITPLFPGMVFTYLGSGYGALDELEGVRILRNNGQPLRLVGHDEERLSEIELGCLVGQFNKDHQRNAAGQFVRYKKRRPRPRAGRRMRKARRAA